LIFGSGRKVAEQQQMILEHGFNADLWSSQVFVFVSFNSVLLIIGWVSSANVISKILSLIPAASYILRVERSDWIFTVSWEICLIFMDCL